MSTQRRILSLMVIALICATASFAQEIKTDYDRSIDFNQYKTYSWERVQTQNPLWSIESKRTSIQHWQRKAGLRLNLAGMFPSLRWG
ncbi:hypothetical protein [Acidicapsa acidisoli]|uniref:hypothetical protein n=1 Tax=Acidicapsa acidisoli TaxID=1615681 RepID=UPI0021DF94C4|nr:hypothetical protein [Acidicapsa acidisoli]